MVLYIQGCALASRCSFSRFDRQWWKDLELSRSAGYRLHLKLKKQKLKIKDWARNQYVAVELVVNKILEDIKGMFGNGIRILSSEDSLKLLELGFAQ